MSHGAEDPQCPKCGKPSYGFGGLCQKCEEKKAMTDAPTGWQPIETAPHGYPVLVAYKNCAGKWRRVRASYYDNQGQLQTADHMEPPDCDEEGYAHPGWYEECETAEYIQPTDEPPILWHPLPKLPEETKT